MSVHHISWAAKQNIQKSTTKFVLIAMCNYADADGVCWPSCAHLCSFTSLNRKTVMKALSDLKNAGYISDTGERKGRTVSVIKYRINMSQNTQEAGPKTDQVQKRTRSNLGQEAGPNLGHGYIIGTVNNNHITRAREGDAKMSRLEFAELPVEWRDWCIKELGWHVDICLEVWSNFSDYWHSKRGASSKKSNWFLTWKNWCRKERITSARPKAESGLAEFEKEKGWT